MLMHRTPRLSLLNSPALLNHPLELIDNIGGDLIPKERSCIDVGAITSSCLLCVEVGECFGEIALKGTWNSSGFLIHAIRVVTGH